jgi:hypothetical protein
MASYFCFANPSGFLFGPSQKGTICSSGNKGNTFVSLVLVYVVMFYLGEWIAQNLEEIKPS